MSEQSCSACNDLREYAPEFVVNGTTDDVGEHLKNDEGLSGANGHVDCEDLLDVNDCLIGNMRDELDGYDVCEWKDFMAAFIGNMYETIKAMVYSQCGQWCAINSLYNGASFSFTEATDGDAYVVAGKGVSFLIPNASSGQHIVDIILLYIAGGLARGAGTFRFFTSDFTDTAQCGNFDNGTSYRISQSRKGNSEWGDVKPNSRSELVAELRYKKSAFPQIKRIWGGSGQEAGRGPGFHLTVGEFDEGSYAHGQHGLCNADGTPTSAGNDSGHLVPSGWCYLQLRMTAWFDELGTESGANHTVKYWCGVRMNQDEIEC